MEYILFIIITMSPNNINGGASVATQQIAFKNQQLCLEAKKMIDDKLIKMLFVDSPAYKSNETVVSKGSQTVASSKITALCFKTE